MSIQRNKLNMGKARRRVQMRSALVLTLGACLIMGLVRLLPARPLVLIWPLQTIASAAVFGGGAYLGLCVLDGDHRKMVPLRRLSRAQILWLALLGVLAVFPASLVCDLLDALVGVRQASSAAAATGAALAAMLLKSALIAPLCEELFFRGYLLGAMKRDGALRAAVVSSLCFALVHAGSLGQLAVYALLGMLLCLMTLHTQSLLAAVLLHMGYNAALIVLSGFGLGALLSGWSLAACAVRLLGSAAFMAVFRRAYMARRAGGTFVLWEGKLSRREIAALAAALILTLLTLMMGG